MKRSRHITLTLLTGASLIVAGCSQNEESQTSFFDSKAACSLKNDPAACDEAEQKAVEKHIETAPKFESKEACEAQFGVAGCTQPANQPAATQAGGGGFFMPLMAGYMMGRMMGGGGIGGLFGGGGAVNSQPVYKDKTGTAFSGKQSAGAFKSGRFEPTSAFRSSVASAPISRGGFGSHSTSASS